MTEKRFDYEDKYITKDGGVFVIAESVRDAELISKTFNRLYEENEQLKTRIQYLETKIQRERNATSKQHLKWSDEAEQRITELEKENEQLKQKIELMKKALRELLESEGNSYVIDLMDRIFNLNYHEWYNPTGHNSEDYVDWEKILNGDVE